MIDNNSNKLINASGIFIKRNPVNVIIPSYISKNLRVYLSEFDFKNFTNEETIELIKRYRKGDQKAFDLLVKSNMKLVLAVANKYNNLGIEFDDLIQEITIALTKAFDFFNYKKNVDFSKFAKWWILREISHILLSFPQIVKLPHKLIILHKQVWSFVEVFEQKYGYLPSVYDLEINIPNNLKWINYVYKLPTDLKETTCLVSDFDIIESDKNSIEEFEMNEYIKNHVQKLLNCLEKRERLIVETFFGFNQEKESLTSLEEKCDLTSERVRQILWESIRKLQVLSGIKKKEELGDTIQIISSEQVENIINIIKTKKGSTKFVAKKIEEALVGDKILYNSKHCTVLEKKTTWSSLCLIIKYDYDTIDNELKNINRDKLP